MTSVLKGQECETLAGLATMAGNQIRGRLAENGKGLRNLRPFPRLSSEAKEGEIFAYWVAPTLGRHLSKRLSTLVNISMETMPLNAKIKTPTNTLSV